MDKEEQVEEQKQEILQQIREKESKIQVLRSTIQHNVKRIDELKKDIDTLKIRTKSSSLSEIQAQIDNRIKEITTIEQEYEEAQEQKSTLERQQTQYQTSTTSFEKQLSLLLEREADLKELFHQQLKINQLDDTFEKYVVKKELKEQMIEEIESFDKKSWANQDAILEQKRKLEKEGSSHSIEVYQSHNQEIENHSRTLKTQQHELIGTEKTVQSILSQIQLNYQTKKGQQEEYLMYKELAEIANGSKETEYISFERYVLGIYFEEIIEAANSRFTQMTNSRYSLIRNKEKTKGAGPKGLDLDVFDNYTGMKRSVKTLSGGESFKASLALALGLSDVIQNHSGGVSVDTLFIDEGFGTLDTDSLDSAIETLVELNQRGRLVGIISHVEELKTRIPVHIKVTKSSKGSYAEIKV
jgi:exonuclease SbcC